jgi:deoxyribodipyrimidine photo-lyase
MKSIIWFRNDLRTLDNPALWHACQSSNEVIAIYLIFEEQWEKHGDAKCKINFWLKSLASLSASLRDLNIPLRIINADNYENTPEVILNFSQKNDISNIFFNLEYPINELIRDREVYKSIQENGIGVHTFHDQVIHEPGTLKTGAGNNFSVYSPFKRKWFELLEDNMLKLYPVPEPRNDLKQNTSDLSDLLKKYHSSIGDGWEIGENLIQKKIREFLDQKGGKYKDERNFPSIDGCSKLSPYLNAGVISSKWCLNEAAKRNNGELSEGDRGIVHWVSEILWREFYRHIIYNFPKVSKNKPFLDYTDKMVWSDNHAFFEAWKKGKTGIPIVDAGIREMLSTGWMHNRTRMIVAMFLSKNLLIDWRWGEEFFMNNLIDGDIASNNGGWQWSASTGTDAAPYFRIMNPMTQSERFDPEGKYIRRWIPELKNCPTKDIHLPPNPESYGYVDPIVDLKESRQNAIKAFENLKN